MAMQKTPARIRAKLHSTIEDMDQNNSAFVKNPAKDFTRHRICTFKNTILNLLTMESHSLNRELYDFYYPLNRKPPSKSAFIQARHKLLPDAFYFLLTQFNKQFPLKKTFKGFHLVACDGTDSNIPADQNDASSFIPYNSNNGGYYQFHTVVLYDLLEKRYTDVIIQPRREMQEAAACCDMVDRLSLDGKTLVIADRGFVSFNVMAHIQERNLFFLIRVKEIDSSRSPFKNFLLPEDDNCEADCAFILSRKTLPPSNRHNVICKKLRSDRSFDFIPLDDKLSSYYLPFRLVKLKIEGSFEYLITNLPANVASLQELKELYHLRWKIETSFLFLKYGIAMNYFHSIRRDFLVQEILAKLVLSNFISLILSCMKLPTSNTLYPYQVSVSDAIYKCRRYLLKHIPDKILLSLLLKDVTPVRPNRCNKRSMQSKSLMSLQNRT